MNQKVNQLFDSDSNIKMSLIERLRNIDQRLSENFLFYKKSEELKIGLV
jgi:hypothetical protein